MNKNKLLKKITTESGITGIDLVIAIIIMSIFIGIITTLMTNIYKQSLEIQSSSYAMAYATVILEKIDKKSFEEVQEPNFIEKLKKSGEITMPDDYKITLSITNPDNVTQDVASVIKKATVTVSYKVNNKEKSMSISKLKVKEIYNGEK